jgi:hypothetical protein
VDTNASLFAIGVMLAQNPINKYDQLIIYGLRLLNKTKQKYITIERKALEWFMLCIISNIFCWETIFKNINHMVLVYLVNKPQVFGRITKWLLLFLEYEFIVVYKPGRTHVVIVFYPDYQIV